MLHYYDACANTYRGKNGCKGCKGHVTPVSICAYINVWSPGMIPSPVMYDTTSSCNVRFHLRASFLYSRVFSPITKSIKSTVNKPEVFQEVLVCSCIYTYAQEGISSQHQGSVIDLCAKLCKFQDGATSCCISVEEVPIGKGDAEYKLYCC